MPYDPRDHDHPSVKLDRFLEAARAQIGDPYRFGAEASPDDADPKAFDSSELVEWSAKRAGFHDMPDGSWNQYRYLHEAGASVPVEEALRTRGALVFGFSSDPLASPDRPARAYVGISLGNGKVLDVSERAGEVREMDPGNFYGYGAKIPEFHYVDDEPPLDDPLGIPGGVGPMPPPEPETPGGRVLHQQFPGDEQYPDGMPPAPEDLVCHPDEPVPEEPVCYPDDDVDLGVAPVTYSDDYGDLSVDF